MQETTFANGVRVENDLLVVESFLTHDADIVSFFNEIKPDERTRTFEMVLKAGTIALRSIRVTEKIDYIQKEFNQLDAKFSKNLDKKLQDLDKRFEDIFGEKGTVSQLIESHFGENGKIVKEIFNPEKEGTPLFALKQDLRRDITDLQQKLGVKKELDLVKARTPLKGYDFENLCERCLSDIVRQNGDELEKTTEKIGTLQRSKKGDYVVTMAGRSNRKIVFEIKDVTQISLAKVHESLEECIKNRDGSYGVFVVRNVEALPQSVGWFNEYSGNQLVCALTTIESEEITNPEILCIAYKWAKTRVLLESSSSEKMDASRVKELVDDLKVDLQKFRTIKTQCTSIEKSAKEIRDVSDELHDKFDERLADILNSIKPKTA